MDNHQSRHYALGRGGIFTRFYYAPPPSPPTSRVGSGHYEWTDPPDVIKRAYLAPSPPPTALNIPSPTPDLCDAAVEFKSRILVGLTGKPEDVSSDEIDAVEQAFIVSYTAVECGDRSIKTVTITIDDDDMAGSAVRSLQDSSSTNYRPFTYIFLASGQCKGCKPEDVLFVESTNRALKQGETKISSRNLQECPCVPPSGDDFLRSFNQTIADLVSNGILVNAVGVTDNFSELEQRNCTDDVTEFESKLFIEFELQGETGDDGALLTEFE